MKYLADMTAFILFRKGFYSEMVGIMFTAKKVKLRLSSESALFHRYNNKLKRYHSMHFTIEDCKYDKDTIAYFL